MVMWSRDQLDQCQQMAELYHAGVSFTQLGRDYHLDPKTVKARLGKLGVSTTHHFKRSRLPGERCHRCEILIAEAPKGAAGLCAFCVKELACD